MVIEAVPGCYAGYGFFLYPAGFRRFSDTFTEGRMREYQRNKLPDRTTTGNSQFQGGDHIGSTGTHQLSAKDGTCP